MSSGKVKVLTLVMHLNHSSEAETLLRNGNSILERRRVVAGKSRLTAQTIDVFLKENPEKIRLTLQLT
jgi:hypothetical protein